MKLFRIKHLVSGFVKRHFAGLQPQNLMTAGRDFPVTTRVDLQSALDAVFSKRYEARPIGVHSSFCPGTISFSHLFAEDHFPVYVGPLQHDEGDVGEVETKRCLTSGLWLSTE